MRNRGVLAKLLLLVVIPVVAICGMGIYGTWNTWATYESVEQVHGTAKEFRESAQEIGDPLNELRQLSLTMVMAPTHEQREELKIEQEALTQRIDATFANWSDLAEDETFTAFQKLKKNWENYKRLKTATVEKVLSGYREEAFINAIDAEADQFELVRQDLAKWMTAKIDRANAVYDSARRRYTTAFWVSTALIAGVVLTMGGFGLATMRSVIQPIQTMRDAATRIAENTSSSSLANALDERIRVKSDDELGELAKAFNQMVENLGKATEKLSIEEQRIQAILNSTADGIITVDRDGVIRSFNASAERLLGYRAEEARGTPVRKVLPKLEQQRGENLRESILAASASAGTENERQTEATTKDGTAIATAVRVTEMNYCGERLAIVTLQDIRERKQAEAERERLFSAIRDAVKRLSAASHHILESTSAQARGAQEQAATVTETVATAEEISSTTEQAVSRANEMSATARRTGEIGDAGRSAIKESVHAMEQVRSQVESIAENILSLAERAQAIGEITATVNDIAEQTNVLALNAAVEASRAGEHGKGFAVVAAEVKSLAEQSKKATSQVRHILSEIQQATNKSVLSTEQGTKSVSEAGKIIAKAGETIDTLASALSDSARSAAQIAASANQQAAGVEQLNEGVLNIDSITRQNGEAIKHIEVSAMNLSKLSRELDALTAAGATHAGVAEGI